MLTDDEVAVVVVDEIAVLAMEEVVMLASVEVATEGMPDEDGSSVLDEASREMEADDELEIDCGRDRDEVIAEELEESAETYIEDTTDEVVCVEKTAEELG